MSFKRIVFDFDDTIAYTLNRDWSGAKPNIELIKKINKLYDDGWTIDVYTARGNISCSSRLEAAAKYSKQIKNWLSKYNVKYHVLSFDKPLADYYVDDKAVTPEDFLKIKLEQLPGGLSGSDIYTDGSFVHKEDKNAQSTIRWFKDAPQFNINVPKIKKLIGNKITMQFIKNDPNFFQDQPYYTLGIIQESLNLMRNNSSYTEFTDTSYIERITKKIDENDLNSIISEKLTQRLNYISHHTGFFHGDFGITNLLFTPEKKLYLIDPIPYVFGSIELDSAKFCASLLINDYDNRHYSLALNQLALFNEISKDDLETLVVSELIRVYPYHPNKNFMKGLIFNVFE